MRTDLAFLNLIYYFALLIVNLVDKSKQNYYLSVKITKLTIFINEFDTLSQTNICSYMLI
jgi:hypothetical protein